ncbi:MAG TPA: isoprenylcysteine carboxylmethyltransferase family protein [Pseudomonas sp.]|uniref:methanethiol S-methyltransferase n=1 Tax=Pseudomonas sp. TaxID=306 RepID=UPI002B752F33|nr:methanethiol S-methyltransferase [Pseudomonas sp.]HTO20575.1 isoprenylcysteine carboxylmethyltransferase family protein [Pseudomonas sp.]
MKRLTLFVYGILCYAVFFATFLYAIAFVGDLPGVPRTIDGAPRMATTPALLIDLLLLTLFAVQHSLMARPAFKALWTRIIPAAAERSTYVLFSSLALILLFRFWQPLGGQVWSLQSTAGQVLMYAGFAFGWALVLYSTFLINHFDLFGLRQVWLQLRGQAYRPLAFKTPGAYRLVRHPLYVGWFFAIWCTPQMSVTHMLFALVTAAYILAAISFEEHDLLAAHPEYADYRRRVPMLLPRLRQAAEPLDEAI